MSDTAPLADFASRVRPTIRGGGYSEDDHWIWCGSVIRGDDGLYHMFASRWTKDVPFYPNWVTNSRIVRAVAATAAGPFHYVEDVLAPRGDGWWDGRMTHNPTIRRHEDRYLLFYTGTTYDDPVPDRYHPFAFDSALWRQARGNQRVGLATAPSPAGPWQRCDAPLVEPSPGRWDALMTTNPAPCVLEDGSILLLYKSAADHGGRLQYGMALAKGVDAAYQKIGDGPFWRFDDPAVSYEDICVWREAGRYHLLFVDMSGRLTAETRSGGYATSVDGFDWTLGSRPQAYSRRMTWDDGAVTLQGSLERPQVLVENGRATYLYCATADGPDGVAQARHSCAVAIPLGRIER